MNVCKRITLLMPRIENGERLVFKTIDWGVASIANLVLLLNS